MRIKTVGTNIKIYAFILGIVTGTIIYNFLNIEYAFSNIKSIAGINFLDSFMFLLMKNLRFLIVAFILSLFKAKDKIVVFIIFGESFLLAGNIVVMILNSAYVLMYDIPIIAVKIICAMLMFNEKRPLLYRMFSVIILITATVLENLFFIKS